MPYRRTERTEAARAQTRARIVRAARELIARGGYREAPVAAVAARAAVATGSVYRHFPSKAELFAEAFRSAAQREVEAVAAAAAGPGDAAQRITAAVDTFARRVLRGRRLAWALLAEPVDPAVEAERLHLRAAYRDVFAAVLCAGVAAGDLPAQDCELGASALVGAIGEALVGPTAPADGGTRDPDAVVDALVAFCLRSVGAPASEEAAGAV